MLSVENPPPDPPCALKFPQVNSTGSDEIEIEIERAANSPPPSKLPLSQPLPEVVVDLPNPLHHQLQFGHLTNFSIRDYVFSARNKDIKGNWPFSLKNLQLCFKYGVKDVLPPFQRLDTLRNSQSLEPSCAVETNSLEKQQESNFSKEPPRPEGRVVLGSSEDVHFNQKLVEPCIDITSCRSADEKDFPSTTTTASQSDIDSVRDTDNRQSSSPLETETLLKAEVGGPPVTSKAESNSRPLASGRKCKLIVKFGGNCDRASTEDIASYCTTVSETMASKVCPVCKTFSSSSNTTLNAHIDQCLSVESTPKWTANSKITRHRIKPKKTRLMVDIYATAHPCTLEELDRRNGTSWATVSTLPTLGTQASGTSSEEKRHNVSPIHPESVGDVGPVYIDADGTKVRILSKSSDPAPAPKVGRDLGARKSFKGSKVSKQVLKKKKKQLAQKHQKYLKLARQSKKIFSHNHKKAHGSQISGNERDNGEGKSCKKEHMLKRKNDSGTFRPWVCSKRRAFTKKMVSNEGHQPMRCKWHSAQDLLVENDPCYSGDSRAEENRVQKYAILPSSGNNERMEKLFHKVLASDKRDKSPGRKGVGNLLVGDKMTDNVVIPCPQTRWGADQLREDIMSIDDSCLPTQKMVGIQEDVTNNSNISPTACSKSSWNSHEIATKSVKLSSSSKNLMSPSRQSTVTRSGLFKIKRRLDLKKSIVHSMRERDEVELPWGCELDQQYALKHGNTEKQMGREEMTENVCLGRSTFPETKQEKGLFSISHSMETLALTSSKYAPCCGDNERLNVYSTVRAGDDFQPRADCIEPCGKGARVHVEGIDIEPSLKSSDGRSATSLNESVDNKFYKLSDSSKAQANSFRSIEEYRQFLCGVEVPSSTTEPDFVHDQEMSSADEVNNRMMEQNADMGLEFDAEVGRVNPFPEVDPIPIPGPPGSFLPSPRDMRSEDFQGNSSLTTSRIQSSPDQHDAVDGDSSDSPISAASTVSNSTAGIPTFQLSEPLSSVVPYADQDKIRSGLIATRIENFVEDAGAASQATSRGVEKSPFDGHVLKVDGVAMEKGFLGFNSDQPCCCQRKERFSQGTSFHNQESQLLRRRRMSSVTLPATEKKMTCTSDPRLTNSNAMPEFVPLSGWSMTGSDKGVLSVIKPSESSTSFKDPPSDEMRFLARTDCGFASPSASNPILRLMGKNLMVVNKDEDASTPHRQVQPQTQNVQKTSQLPTLSAVCSDKILKQDPHVYRHMIPQGSVIFSQDSHSMVGQCSEVGSLSGFRSYSEWKLPQAPARLPAGMFRDQRSGGGFSTLEPYEHKVDHSFPGRESMLKNRPNAPSAYTMEKNEAPPDSRRRLSVSTVPHVKEIIVTDDVRESESFLTSDVARYGEGWRESQVVSSAISIPTVPNQSGNGLRPFSFYESQDRAYHNESPVKHNANFHATSASLANASPITWVCTLEGPGVLYRSPFASASSSASHLRSAALYYPPSYS